MGLPHAARRRALGAREADAAPPARRDAPARRSGPDGRRSAPLVDNLGDRRRPDRGRRPLPRPPLRSLFLDSATGADARGREPSARPLLVPDRRSRARSSAARGARPRSAAPAVPWTPVDADPLLAVRELLAPFAAAPVPGLPPFQGGAAGYLGYDYGARARAAAAARVTTTSPCPTSMLGLYDWVDRLGPPARRPPGSSRPACPRPARRARPRAAERAGDGAGAAARTGAAAPAPPAASRAGARPPAPREAPSYPVLGVEGAEAIGLRSTFTHRGYLDAVARVREYILAGDIFQANLSQRFQAPLAEPPFELYRRLRRAESGRLRRLPRLRRRPRC